LKQKPVITDGLMEEIPHQESLRASTVKNDTPNKFWASVEPYCAPFTDDDLKVLSDWIDYI